MTIVDVKWLKSTALSAVQSFAHATLGVFGGNIVNVLQIDWGDTLSIGAGAALVSVLTSVVSLKINTAMNVGADANRVSL